MKRGTKNDESLPGLKPNRTQFLLTAGSVVAAGAMAEVERKKGM